MIKFTLIENSLDSIEQGLKFLKDAEKTNCASSFKHSLLSLFQGSELILKEILIIIDPIIIFDKNSLFRYCELPLNPTVDELYNCKSIDIGGIGRELKKHYPNIFSNSNLKVLDKLAKERNKIQHFAIEILPSELLQKLLQLYFLLIKPAFKIIQKSRPSNLDDDEITYDSIDERVSTFEKEFLKIKIGEGFHQGMCPKCHEYDFFIIFDGESYPFSCYCTTCDYQLKDISPEDYHLCPECDSLSLVYDTNEEAGLCLWHKCYYCKEGGFIPMESCDTCTGYIIEESCPECCQDEV